uniref:Uncharacterized protein n=1 Tax=Anguilla anguilla TaxID=7936 RepID=A0A0E9QIR0_ANGAN
MLPRGFCYQYLTPFYFCCSTDYNCY